MSFGKTLAGLRDAAGLTQAELAQRAGVSLDTLRRWEQDRNLPRIDDAFRLAEALGVSLDKLILRQDVEEMAQPRPGRPRRQAEPPPEKKPRRGQGKG